MAKKFFFMFSLLMAMLVCMADDEFPANGGSGEQIELQVYYDDSDPESEAACDSTATDYIDPSKTYPHRPRTPMHAPCVCLNDHTLTFVIDHPDYVLTIKDEDGEEVYTTTVFSTETQVALPATLSGEYEIELVMGNWIFTGYITL